MHHGVALTNPQSMNHRPDLLHRHTLSNPGAPSLFAVGFQCPVPVHNEVDNVEFLGWREHGAKAGDHLIGRRKPLSGPLAVRSAKVYHE